MSAPMIPIDELPSSQVCGTPLDWHQVRTSASPSIDGHTVTSARLVATCERCGHEYVEVIRVVGNRLRRPPIERCLLRVVPRLQRVA